MCYHDSDEDQIPFYGKLTQKIIQFQQVHISVLVTTYVFLSL